jgi:hypothetical protein
MIEVVIDFDEIGNDCNHFNSKDINLMCNLFRYVYKKLNIINQVSVNWDAFSDNLSDILIKEFPTDYEYNPDDEWGWSDYADYQSYVETDRSIGPKNEEGVRDDMRLILVNFYDFNHKHRELAQDFLSTIVETYSEVKNHKYTEEDELLKFQILIES